MYKIIFLLSIVITSIKCTTTKSLSSTQPVKDSVISNDTLNHSKIKTIYNFPKKLNENSGIESDQNFIWTFNDSGEKNILYKTNFKGTIVKELTITNAKNIDWEDITSDDLYIYIGDFGNNNGNRKDLTIYKIKKSDLNINFTQNINAELITFEYSNRIDFQKKPYDHDFDCESMFIYKDQIHLLTKAWKTGISSHFVLPTKAGTHEAQLLEKLDTKGFLTAADNLENMVAAVQYTLDGELTLWDFTFDKKGLLFSNSIKAVHIGNTSNLGQIEGLMFFNNKMYISSEKIDGILPTLYLIE